MVTDKVALYTATVLIGAAIFLGVLGLAAGFVYRRKHTHQETYAKKGGRGLGQALDKRIIGGSLKTVDELQFQHDTKGKMVCLGKDAVGAVYKARWKGTLVAVKLLTSQDAAQRAEFEHEIALLERLRHSHVVNYLGHIFGAKDEMMLITEFMQGGALGARIHAETGPDRHCGWYRAGAGIALSIARGLTYLHSMNIVWFDCKPSNVLLDHSGYVAKITGFGLSLMLAESTNAFLRGTVGYMAPELFTMVESSDESHEKRHPITTAVDIYSFGLVLLELIMKHRPPLPRGVLSKPRVPEDCPQDILDLYLKCLATDPRDRPEAVDVMETIAASMVGSRSGSLRNSLASGDYKSTLNGESITFERKPNGELCMLGRGRFGKVYKGRFLRQLVAIKVLTDNSPEQQEAFRQETLLLRDLRHPHVVQYLGHAQLNGNMLLVLEYMQGKSLAAAIAGDSGNSERRLAWHRQGLGIALGVASGLQYLHSKRVIWFDCKSHNILLDASGTVAKISDVGISKVLLNTCTQAFMRGTPGYLAPELVPQLCGTSGNGESYSVSHAVDIYSFGIVLWEIITGENPQKYNGCLRTPRVPEECSADAVKLYQQCLSHKIRDRPTIETILQMLHAEKAALNTTTPKA